MRDTPRARVMFAVALIAALALIAIDYQNASSPVVRAVKGVGGSVLGSAERAVSSVSRPVGRFVGSGLAGAGTGDSVAALELKLTRLRAQLSAAELARAKYRQLGRLLQLAGTGRYRVVAASVIAFGQGFARSVTLDAGSADGVRTQQTVIDGDGLVGQVVAVSAHTCTVLLADAPGSVVGIRLAPSGEVGWVTGQGSGGGAMSPLLLQVPGPASVLTLGEQLVTAASLHDRPFVPGVPVGVIVAVRNRAGSLAAEALVRPYVNFGALDVVGIVIESPPTDPRFSVLPPRPSPSPSPSPSPKPSPAPSASARHGRGGRRSRP